LIAEGKDVADDARRRFESLAQRDTSALVRLYLASALQRMEPGRRWEIVRSLSEREEAPADQSIPLMVWYALERCGAPDATRATELAKGAKLPGLADFVSRRITDGKD